jgi:hypothetical protein
MHVRSSEMCAALTSVAVVIGSSENARQTLGNAEAGRAASTQAATVATSKRRLRIAVTGV